MKTPKSAPRAIKVFTFDEVIEEAKRRQAEFDALPEEEKARRTAAAEEALKKLRGTPGFMQLQITPRTK